MEIEESRIEILGFCALADAIGNRMDIKNSPAPSGKVLYFSFFLARKQERESGNYRIGENK